MAVTFVARNSDVRLNTYRERISEDNIEDILCDCGYDFVLDCTDNFPAKFLINDAYVRLNKSFSHAGVTGFSGQSMTVVPQRGSCYRCIFEDVPDEGTVPTCCKVGVLGAVVGVVGSL